MSSPTSSGTAASAARKEGITVDALPQTLAVVDCEKRRGVSRYYAYVIEVTRKNREQYHIYRRYRQFHKMTQRLEERFPIEAGSIRASDRIIPQLPGKKYIGRSAVRDVAELRMPYLDDFLKKLYMMSDKIRYDSIVLAFLKPNHEDMNRPYRNKGFITRTYPGERTDGGRNASSSNKPKPPRPSTGPGQHSSSFSSPIGKPLPVPSIKVSFTASSSSSPKLAAKSLPPRPTPPQFSQSATPTKGPRAKVLYNYKAHYEDELSLKAGSVVTLLRKLDGDWYEGRLNGHIGMVPGNYINIIEPLPQEEDFDGSSEETDEWDDDSTGKIICQYKMKKIPIEVDSELIKRPTFSKLMFVLRAKLKDSKITINYKDSTGDLIEVIDDTDLMLMKDISSTAQTTSADTASWILYITKSGDTSVYNTRP